MEDKERWEHCLHMKDIAIFCELCKILLCEDCATEHLEHGESLDRLNNKVQDYIYRIKKGQTNVRVLLKRDLNVELMKKGKFMPERIRIEMDAKLQGILKDLGELLDSIRGALDKETIVNIICGGRFLEIGERIRSSNEELKDIIKHCKHLGDLETINEFSTQGKQVSSIGIRAPGLIESDESACTRYYISNEEVPGYIKNTEEEKENIHEYRSQSEIDNEQIISRENVLRANQEKLEALKMKYQEESMNIERDINKSREDLEMTKKKINERKPKEEKKSLKEFKKTTFLGKFEEDCICPITQQMMIDPVIAADGRSYEREAITEWLKNHNTSPCTNLVLVHKFLTPNLQLRSLIQTIKKI